MTAFHSESTHEMPSGTRPAVVAAVSTTTSPSTVTRTSDPDGVAPCKASNIVRGQHRGTVRGPWHRKHWGTYLGSGAGTICLESHGDPCACDGVVLCHRSTLATAGSTTVCGRCSGAAGFLWR